ncbi:carbon storage regulator CsrA [Mesobacillus selenatarsenatis]|uniref:Translational regulator CsrA n=1 Tax=Mesobacillus selenatarsenatis (strain DSM 18680 / JCM 14380 / FERM P-15431 / SF-1) TaxID=1321606 RepID=A0A0A8WWL1_MESS1|nr:carbon storage regulator CsrA [Mesobacillus selenatarsenatis]GAM11993.1 carbon storage regulator [Mesobacillus selenatarsenatis SF-1]
MLVLSRKNGESIKIGDDIEITIISSKNDQVKIGIKAPKNIEVFRKEILEQIQSENEQASKDISSMIEFMKK